MQIAFSQSSRAVSHIARARVTITVPQRRQWRWPDLPRSRRPAPGDPRATLRPRTRASGDGRRSGSAPGIRRGRPGFETGFRGIRSPCKYRGLIGYSDGSGPGGVSAAGANAARRSSSHVSTSDSRQRRARATPSTGRGNFRRRASFTNSERASRVACSTSRRSSSRSPFPVNCSSASLCESRGRASRPDRSRTNAGTDPRSGRGRSVREHRG